MIIHINESSNFEKVGELEVKFSSEGNIESISIAKEFEMNEVNAAGYPGFFIHYPNNGSAKFAFSIIPDELMQQHRGRLKIKGTNGDSTRTIFPKKNPDGTYEVKVSIYRVIDKKEKFSGDEASKTHIDAGLSFLQAEPEGVYKFINGDISLDEFKDTYVTHYETLSTATRKEYAKKGNKELIK